jgi:hypothetical protein
MGKGLQKYDGTRLNAMIWGWIGLESKADLPGKMGAGLEALSDAAAPVTNRILIQLNHCQSLSAICETQYTRSGSPGACAQEGFVP